MFNDTTHTSRAAFFLQPDATVEQILLEFPATATVFNAFGIDVCCGGGASLAAAADSDGIELQSLLAALEGAIVGEHETPR